MFHSELIFPLNGWHNHASSIVECPNGDLLVCWFSGSGERTADDAQILGARRRSRSTRWSQPFLMADTPNYPDCNPCLFIDPAQRLWLVWITILNHRWEGSLLKYRCTRDYQRALAPRWQWSEVLHISPDEQFVQKVDAYAQRMLAQAGTYPPDLRPYLEQYCHTIRQYAQDDLSRRLGWMTRLPPLIIGKHIWLPLYSDGFSCSLIAISENNGDSWQLSEPILAPGAIQPALAVRRDGTLVAYMRDNGPPPKRVWMATSNDGGFTWSEPTKTEIPNPGSSVAVLALRTGEWIMVCNDTEQGRHRLTVLLSDDEGRTWRTARYLEKDAPGTGSYSYPALIQAHNGIIHATYSYALEREGLPVDERGRPKRSAIKWAQFTRDWLLSSETNRQ
ncbi:MAG: neuraminidase (sialidase)-like protein [Armatimonadota bacterium]